MNNHTAAALEQAAYNLGQEAARDERSAQNHRDQADAYAAKAAGLRDAVVVIAAVLEEHRADEIAAEETSA